MMYAGNEQRLLVDNPVALIRPNGFVAFFLPQISRTLIGLGLP